MEDQNAEFQKLVEGMAPEMIEGILNALPVETISQALHQRKASEQATIINQGVEAYIKSKEPGQVETLKGKQL